MQIIAGAARKLVLTVPEGLDVRPTAVRARKALFDSLGDFSGQRVLDLFSGSGALALEAASRGAVAIFMVELSAKHHRIVQENLARVQKCGVRAEACPILEDALEPRRYASKVGKVDLILADPPYSQSASFFQKLMLDKFFREYFVGVRLVWEIPDEPGSVGIFLQASKLIDSVIRKFGGVDFLLGRIA